MTSEEFLINNHEWLKNQSEKFYAKYGKIIGMTAQDCYQEAFLMLPDILAKYSHQTNITMFVWNRLRGKFRDLMECEVRKLVGELEYGIDSASELVSNNYSDYERHTEGLYIEE